MTKTKTLSMIALSAVLAGSVYTVAAAEGMGEGPDMGNGMGPGMGQMLNFDAIDANKDGKITTEEFAAFRTAEFAKADTNGDGQLSADEISAKHIADVTARAAEMAAKMIERMDENADGQLSAQEVAQGPRAPTMFERIDTDGDGAVSKAEVDAMKGRMGHRGGRFHKG